MSLRSFPFEFDKKPNSSKGIKVTIVTENKVLFKFFYSTLTFNYFSLGNDFWSGYI